MNFENIIMKFNVKNNINHTLEGWHFNFARGKAQKHKNNCVKWKLDRLKVEVRIIVRLKLRLKITHLSAVFCNVSPTQALQSKESETTGTLTGN